MTPDVAQIFPVAVIFGALTVLTSLPTSADQMLAPQSPPELTMTCTATEECWADPSREGTACGATDLAFSFVVDGPNQTVVVTRPNGSNVTGAALMYNRHGVAPYVVMATSDGAGAGHLTLLPDRTFIATSHLTLARNMAKTTFGICEDAS